MICPLMCNRGRYEVVDCMKNECALWLGEGCSIAYIGGNCKANLRPWNERKSDER